MMLLWIAAVTGVILLAFWEADGRSRKARGAAALHVALAACSVVTWTIFGIARFEWLGRLSLGLLAGTIAAGISTVLISHRQRDPAAERAPIRVIAIHTAASVIATSAAAVAFGG